MWIKKSLSDNYIYSKTLYQKERKSIILTKVLLISLLLLGSGVTSLVYTQRLTGMFYTVLLLGLVGLTYLVFIVHILNMRNFIELTAKIIAPMGMAEIEEFGRENKYKFNGDRIKVFRYYIKVN